MIYVFSLVLTPNLRISSFLMILLCYLEHGQQPTVEVKAEGDHVPNNQTRSLSMDYGHKSTLVLGQQLPKRHTR